MLLLALASTKVLYAAYSATSFAYRWYLRPQRKPKDFGDWALVTGSAKGIGKAYAKGLAQLGKRAE